MINYCDNKSHIELKDKLISEVIVDMKRAKSLIISLSLLMFHNCEYY